MTPIRAIVGRFSYDYSQQTMEEVLQQRPFDFCAIISTGIPQYFDAIPRERQEWFSSGEIRGCEYKNVNWNALIPLDEKLIEHMRDCEAVFMEVVSRLEWKRRISYTIRKRWYLRHLRFWNDYLSRHHINLYLSAWMPHEIPDLVIYHLCKLRGIHVLYLECCGMVRGTSFVEHDWEESASQISPRYEALLAQYEHGGDPHQDILLEERFEERYQQLVRPEGAHPAYVIHLSSYWQKVWEQVCKAPLSLIRYVWLYLTPGGMRRAFGAFQRQTITRAYKKFYDAHAVEPDLRHRFVYLPLHYQPEASTVPMSGCFGDQELMIQMLHAYLPPDVLIYVKENPWENGWLKRSVDFYKDLLTIPTVRLMKKNADTFLLREHCMAVATGSGTAGFEALFRGKPVFLFGHRFYQYARGVYRIHSSKDCADAVRAICVEGKKPTLIESRLYLKAMEETCIDGALSPCHYEAAGIPRAEQVHAHSQAILRDFESFLR